MQITFVSLRNFRVFASLDLELPPGLVGIYGPNGAGKSSLLEAILWALYGRARTGKADIRTAGSSGECSVELSFVHEDHHYVVRRSISGVNSTVKARVDVGGQTVADGPTEVGRFLRSTLGMEEAAFRSSVFAEQKQLAAFSDATPETRRRLVLQLLGITPIEKARDAARSDARAKRADHERLLQLLPDLGRLEERLRSAQLACTDASTNLEVAKRSNRHANEAVRAVEESVRELEMVRSTHELITQKGKAARAERDRAEAAVAQLDLDLATLRDAVQVLQRMGDARSESERNRVALRLALLERFEEAVSAADRFRMAEPGFEAAELEAELSALSAKASRLRSIEAACRAEVAAARAFLKSATEAATRAAVALDRSATLTAQADCPLCGQELGAGFASVQAHRAAEMARSEVEVHEAGVQARAALAAAETAGAELRAAESDLADKSARLQTEAAELAKRKAAEERVADFRDKLGAQGGAPRPNERSELAALVESDRLADQQRAVLVAQLERLPVVERAREAERNSLEAADALRSRLRFELEELHFDVRRFAALDHQRTDTSARAELALNALQAASTSLAKAEQEVASSAALLEQASVQHTQAAGLAEEVRYIGRSADLLHGFRQQIVAAIGPRLEVQASELFNVLTAGEYDGIRLDPESYEISIIDAGVPYLSARFSGSEIDLANLALRVAISEQVRFQAGGQVGLLVLDEALASLDVDRKDRMLGALTQLSGRFRQILVVTHAPEVKERLPQAIEVVKLPGRRATARVVEVGSAS
jgi:DNA repair protein SbcC/Rad50